MARGKQTCRILKEIRRQIAAANDIEFITSECRYQGDCLGTCPKCEAEVRYLEQQLSNRRLMGKAVVLAGLSAGMIAMSGCGSPSPQKAENTDPLQGEPDTEMLKCKIAPDSAVTEPVDSAVNETVLSSDSLFEIIVGGEVIPDDVQTAAECPDSAIVCDDSESVDTVPEKEYATIFGQMPKMASFPGGDAALKKWLSENVTYPEKAYEDSVQGAVVVTFFVDEDGSIRNARVVRSVSPELDEEALRVVGKLPNFIPGESDGKPEGMYFTLPIRFRIQ